MAPRPTVPPGSHRETRRGPGRQERPTHPPAVPSGSRATRRTRTAGGARGWAAQEPPLERCAELLSADLAAIHEAATNVEPYIRADGTRIWSLMQLERRLRPRSTGVGEAATLTADGPQPPTHRNRSCPVRGAIVRARATASLSGSAPGLVSPGWHLRPGRTMNRWRPLRTARLRWHVDQATTINLPTRRRPGRLTKLRRIDCFDRVPPVEPAA
jgi:hypothetical protein